MCMWVFNEAKTNFDRITAYRTFYATFCIVGYGVYVINSSCSFLMDHFETLHTCCGHIEDVHMAF